MATPPSTSAASYPPTVDVASSPNPPLSELKALPDCDTCGKPATESCAGCMTTFYCGRACQLKKWPTHKDFCRSSPIFLKNQEVKKLKETIEEQGKALGVDHVDTLLSVSNLGSLLRVQGKLSQAEPFVHRALEGRERIL